MFASLGTPGYPPWAAVAAEARHLSALLINILLGLLPTFALGAGIALRADDDARRQRKMFLLVYGLWALTLAMWNWMRGTQVAWIVLWSVAGVAALAWCAAMRERTSVQPRRPQGDR